MIRRSPCGYLSQIDESAYVEQAAIICGKGIIEENVFVGPYAVLRADGVLIHSKSGAAVTIGRNTSIAHRSIVHGPCAVGDNVFIGFNSVLFNCTLGDGCVVRHNAVVDGADLPAGFYVPSTTQIAPAPALMTFRALAPRSPNFPKMWRVPITN